MSADLVARTRAVCGSWPLLLSLVHGAVAEAVRTGGDGDDEMREILAALRTDGITALDVASADQRGQAAALDDRPLPRAADARRAGALRGAGRVR